MRRCPVHKRQADFTRLLLGAALLRIEALMVQVDLVHLVVVVAHSETIPHSAVALGVGLVRIVGLVKLFRIEFISDI